MFYVTVEFLVGTLPWKGKEKDKIGALKKQHTNSDLVKHLPNPVQHLYLYLSSLEYSSLPDYQFIESLYQEMFQLSQMPEDVPFDWDMNESTAEITRTEDEYPVLVSSIHDVIQAESSMHDVPMAAEPNHTMIIKDSEQTLGSRYLEPRYYSLTRPPKDPNPKRSFRNRKLKTKYILVK